MYFPNAQYRFINGGCGILAHEIAKHLPEDCSIIYTTYEGSHAFVVSGCREFAVDINGVTTLEEMAEKYGFPTEHIESGEMGLFFDDCDEDCEVGIFPNTREGRKEFAEATDWFFEPVDTEGDYENTDREVWYWADLRAEELKYKIVPNYPWAN